jgi:hypothetical protein
MDPDSTYGSGSATLPNANTNQDLALLNGVGSNFARRAGFVKFRLVAFARNLPA